jgi:diguanylate cyclase (GGDEF)-like protein
MAVQSRRVVLCVESVALVAVVAFAAHGLLPDSGDVAWFFDYPVYYGLVCTAAALVAARAILVRRNRAGWAVMAVAVGLYAAAEFTWLALYAGDSEAPYPSAADALYLAFFPASYVALVLLFRTRVRTAAAGLWIDGLTAALAAAALGSAILVEAVLDTTDGSLAVVATNVAYPLGDVILLSLVVAAFVLTRWRPGRAWLLIGLALAAFAVGDSIYLYATAAGTYTEGGLLDLAWPTALLLIGAAAWHDAAARRPVDTSGRPLLAVPAICGAISVGVLLVDHWSRTNLLAVVLATSGLAAVLVRLALVFRENRRLLERTRHESVTDPLTSLGNRRRLMRDLDAALAVESGEQSWLLAIFDLDGFKGYNDAFGHLAGDALLARLGANLGSAVGVQDATYRLGGDEFCLLVPIADGEAGRVIDRTADALSEQGEGFRVTSSFGAVVLPDDASQPQDALRLADERLYAQKHSKRAQRDRPHETLLQALFEKEPELHVHVEDVADLAVAVGHLYGLSQQELDQLQRAAQLHDIGKIAIPDGIVRKPDPLTAEEWAFVRRHTLIGERILTASPALRPVARIVRSTHERWDGAGYPDGLSGERIPLAARIIAVCDAFHAMTTNRPYRAAVSVEAALAELDRCAGTQFDPDVVMRFAIASSARTTRAAA